MCILCLWNDFWMCHAILGSTFRNKTTSKLRPLTTVPRVVVFVRFYCTTMRKTIQPEVKLAVTLHHLAEGSTQSSIALHYRLGRSTVSQIIYDTCKAIWTVLQPIYLSPPKSPEDWKAIAKGLALPNYIVLLI